MNIPHSLEWDSPIALNLFPHENWEPHTNYELQLLSKDFPPAFGRALKDSLTSINFKTSDYQGFGNLIINTNLEEEENIELPNDDFTDNDIRIAWKKFCDKEKVNGNNNMLSLLNMNDPVIENNSIIISTINKMNQKEVKGYKNKIQAFISKELNNYGITVDVSLDKVKQKKNFVDSKDKLDTLVKENDNISLLINEFKLRI